MSDQQFPLDLIERYAPTPDSVASEWGSARREDVLAGVLGPAGSRTEAVHSFQLQFDDDADVLPPGRARAGRLALAGSVAALVAAAAVCIALVPSGDSGGAGNAQSAGGAGTVFIPPPGLSDTALGAEQVSYRVDQQIDVGPSGAANPDGPDAMLNRNWVSTNGDIRSVRTGSQNGCMVFPIGGPANFEAPSLAFFASLPTDVDALNSYFRSHVEGSSSRDEAVFVAVGDALRTADGLASPRLRAAMLAVLSRTPGVTIHENVSDYLGRPAVRADFVNQTIRPGEVASLYFDPTTFQLLESRDGSNNSASAYAGPSPAYNAPAPTGGDDPDVLGGAAFVEVMQSETVLDALPSLPSGCAGD